MKTLTSKQHERNEKKKKKLVALAKLVQLNDSDRQETSTADEQKTVTANDTLEKRAYAADDGFTKVTHKKKTSKNKTAAVATEAITINGDEPRTKRLKLGQADKDESELHLSDNSNESGRDEHLQRMKLTLTDEQYKELRCQLRERKRNLENVPSLRLREFGQRATLETPQEQRTPIFLTDIQHLLMSALIGKKSPCTPDRWCFLDKPLRLSHSVVVILEGLSLYHYLSNESKFEQTNKIFSTRLELMLPPSKEGMIIEEMTQVPLTNVQAQQLIDQHGSLESAVEMNKDPTLLVKAIFPIESASNEAGTKDDAIELAPGDKFPRTKLLLSALQMVDEGYPMPLRGELAERFKTFAYTQTQYTPVTDRSPMFGIDCEMCRTTAGFNELTRISIVNEKLETVYETLVMPTNKITDYLTRYSGITPEIMKAVTKTLPEVQEEVRSLLPSDAILVGQSLNSDLNAMKMMHPYVIDTSVCFNLSGVRKRKSKLQTLAMTFLKEAIQENVDGHDSVEDSLASLKLVKMKLANSLEFGDEILTQKKRLHDIIRIASADCIKNNLFAHALQRDKRTAIITAGSPLQKETKEILQKAEEALSSQDSLKSVSLYELDSNKAAVKKAREIALEHSLTIANLQLQTDEFRLDVVGQTVEKLDKWIHKLWKSVAHNGMLLVVMGGSVECPSGVAKIAIKKNVAEVVKEAPITL